MLSHGGGVIPKYEELVSNIIFYIIIFITLLFVMLSHGGGGIPNFFTNLRSYDKNGNFLQGIFFSCNL